VTLAEHSLGFPLILTPAESLGFPLYPSDNPIVSLCRGGYGEISWLGLGYSNTIYTVWEKHGSSGEQAGSFTYTSMLALKPPETTAVPFEPLPISGFLD
jgi:hypothetical protein